MNKRLTVHDLKVATDLLAPYKVKLRFDLNLEGGGCLAPSRLIIIGLSVPKKHLFSLICHELGHILAYENGDYLEYHDYSKFKKLTKKQKRRVSWEAEQYVDNLGEQIFKNLGLNKLGYKYRYFYTDNEAKKWLWKYLGVLNERRSSKKRM